MAGGGVVTGVAVGGTTVSEYTEGLAVVSEGGVTSKTVGSIGGGGGVYVARVAETDEGAQKDV